MTEELSRNEKIYYIHEHVNSMRKDHRIEVGKMIRCDGEVPGKLCNKGGGSQIAFQFLSDSLINTLYSYIKQKNESVHPLSPSK